MTANNSTIQVDDVVKLKDDFLVSLSRFGGHFTIRKGSLGLVVSEEPSNRWFDVEFDITPTFSITIPIHSVSLEKVGTKSDFLDVPGYRIKNHFYEAYKGDLK